MKYKGKTKPRYTAKVHYITMLGIAAMFTISPPLPKYPYPTSQPIISHSNGLYEHKQCANESAG